MCVYICIYVYIYFKLILLGLSSDLILRLLFYDFFPRFIKSWTTFIQHQS